MVSARMRKHSYTAVVCMAVLSLTLLPLAGSTEEKAVCAAIQTIFRTGSVLQQPERKDVFINRS
jgi:hypothetical protein